MEDIQTRLIRERAKKSFSKKTNPVTKRPYNYAWRFPTLRFTKPLREELRLMIEDNQIDAVRQRWSLLRKIGKQPSPHAVQMMVEFLSRTQQAREAPAVIATMENDPNPITPDTWRHLAAGYIRENELLLAEDALAHLPADGRLNGRLYGAYLAHAIRSGDDTKTTEWRQQVTESGVISDASEAQQLVAELPVDFLSGSGDQVVSLLESCGMTVGDARDVLAYCLAREGRLDAVQAIVDQAGDQEEGVATELLDSLLLAQTKAGQIDQALQTLKTMQEKADDIGMAAYNDLIRACADAKRSEDVERLLYQLGRIPTGPYALVALMKYYAEQGDVTAAKKYWHGAARLHALTDVADSHPVIALVAKEDHVEAQEMYEKLNQNHMVPLPETFDVVAEALRRNNLEKQARIVEQHRRRNVG